MISPHTRLIELLKVEAKKPAGPDMSHEPTRKFIQGEYPQQQTAEYQRLNFGNLD